MRGGGKSRRGVVGVRLGCVKLDLLDGQGARFWLILRHRE